MFWNSHAFLTKDLCVGRISFLFFWRCDQFSLWTKWVLRHKTHSRKWEIPLLRWFLIQGHPSAIGFLFSFLSAYCCRQFQTCLLTGLINQYIIPFFAREVGFCQASPDAVSRGSGHIISGLFLLISPSHGSLSVNILDLTERVATMAVTGQPTAICWPAMPLIYASDTALSVLARRSIQSSLSGHHMIFNITLCEDVYTAELLYGICRNRERRDRISIKLLIQHFPNLSIKGRVIAPQSVVTPNIKNLFYRKRLKEFGLERGNVEQRYVTRIMDKIANISEFLFYFFSFLPSISLKARTSEYKIFEVRSK